MSIHLSCLAPIAAAQDDWFYNSRELVLNTDISSSIDITRGPGAYIDYITANLSFVPQERKHQHILEQEVEPDADLESGNYVFRWTEPKNNKLDFSVETRLRIKNSIKKVTHKVQFPLNDVPKDIAVYVKATDNIDVTADIAALASGLVEGKDDLYEVVFELAKWTKNNVEYDISTLTSGVSQPASWVLRTRIGVCDELTNLFIAMCRSLGIPARFVSGIAYTDSPKFPENWGSHGWAEVYFPGFG